MRPRRHLSVSLDAETTRLLLGEVPAAFHAGVNDILLIAFGLAWAKFLGTGGRRSVSTSKATGVTKSWPPSVDLSRTVGWFTTKYPVALSVGELDWDADRRRRSGFGGTGQRRQRAASRPARPV